MAKAENPYRNGVLIAVVIISISFIPVFMSERVLDAFVREDRIYETLSPICLFLTSAAVAITFLRSKARFDLRNAAWIRRMIFLGLTLLFFVAAGEEISWGQPILGNEARTAQLISVR